MLAGNMNLNRKRPVGITIIAVLLLWVGLGCAIFGPYLGMVGVQYDLWHADLATVIHSDARIRTICRVLDVIDYLIYIALAVIGFGLWKLKHWARVSVISLEIIGFVGAVILPFVFHRPISKDLTGLGLSVVQTGWVVFYFTRPRVRHAFGKWNLYAPDGEWIEPPILSVRWRFGIVLLFAATVFLTALL